MSEDNSGVNVLSPSKRPNRASIRPSHATAAFPLGDYLVPTADPQGRSVSLNVSMSPSVRRIASIILAKRLFGFQNEQDVLRWCIDNGLKQLEKNAKDKNITSEVSVLNVFTTAALNQMEYAHYDNVLGSLAASIDLLMTQGHWVKAEELADLAWRNLDKLDDPYWRKRFRDRMYEKRSEVKQRAAKAAKDKAAREKAERKAERAE